MCHDPIDLLKPSIFNANKNISKNVNFFHFVSSWLNVWTRCIFWYDLTWAVNQIGWIDIGCCTVGKIESILSGERDGKWLSIVIIYCTLKADTFPMQIPILFPRCILHAVLIFLCVQFVICAQCICATVRNLSIDCLGLVSMWEVLKSCWIRCIKCMCEFGQKSH